MTRPFFHLGFVVTFIFSVAAIAATASKGSIQELSKRTIAMPMPTDCKVRGICDLKNVSLVERKIKVSLAGEPAEYATYMTDLRFVVTTAQPADLTKYGVVQFMKGCMYRSELQTDGTETRAFRYVHKNFGQYALLRHDDWVVDSSHADPLATAFEGHGRFDLYKWNTDPTDLESDGATWYFHASPPHGTVFKSDLVANAGLIDGAPLPSARNSSLELETCVFKIQDVPLVSDPSGAGIDRSKAIWCGSWDHKFRYDFSSQKIVQERNIHPFCREPSDGPL